MSNPVPKIILHSDQTLPLTGTRDAELLRSLSGKKIPESPISPLLLIPDGSTSKKRGRTI